MAEGDDSEKTEDPTQKRLDEAQERGDVVKSQEVGNWFVILAVTILLGMTATGTANKVAGDLKELLANAGRMVDAEALRSLFLSTGAQVGLALALPIAVLVAAALAGNLIQHRLVWSAEQLKPKFSKISPLAGAKRLFSPESLVNLAKGLIKLVLIGTLMVMLIWPEAARLDTIMTTDPADLLPVTLDLSLKLMIGVACVLAIMAALDYLWQRYRWMERQKMSLQEVKEEFKQAEGDPKIKSKLRQIRLERSRKRMMAAVPKASVVITNPTHFAVALRYDDNMPAPVCVAKGVDAVAFRIRDLAKEHDVPVVENPPLARALHASVDLDEPIPVEHYRAVAEVIGFVMRMRNAPRGWQSS